jgi:prepilin-type processing-associated H-X9-DG protein
MIELLVVIAIIAILAAIIFPVFAKSREKARQTACESNEKQILTGITMYAQDYDEKMPPSFIKTPDGKIAVWNQIVEPIVKNEPVFQCGSDPSDTPPTYSTPTPNVPTGLPEPFHTSYIANVSVLGQGGLPLAQIKQPASTVLLCDGGVIANTTAPYVTEISTIKPSACFLADLTVQAGGSPAVTSQTNDFAAPSMRHNDITNVGFVDSHVKAMKPDAWYMPNSPWLDPKVGGDAGANGPASGSGGG